MIFPKLETKWLRTELRTGEPQQAGTTRLTPVSQAVILQYPGRHGGLVWNRPVAMQVTQADGSERTLPIPDPTRNILLALLVIGLVGSGLIRLFFGHRR